MGPQAHALSGEAEGPELLQAAEVEAQSTTLTTCSYLKDAVSDAGAFLHSGKKGGKRKSTSKCGLGG